MADLQLHPAVGAPGVAWDTVASNYGAVSEYDFLLVDPVFGAEQVVALESVMVGINCPAVMLTLRQRGATAAEHQREILRWPDEPVLRIRVTPLAEPETPAAP